MQISATGTVWPTWSRTARIVNGPMRRFLARTSRWVAVSTAGFALITVGVVMLVTPGPGLLLIVAGLTILSFEFEWAESLRERAASHLRATSSRLLTRIRRARDDAPVDHPRHEPTGSLAPGRRRQRDAA